LTIRAPRIGLVRFKVLPLGISSAVALFQRQIDDLLGEDLIDAGVRVCLDDILIFSKTLDDHLVLLDKVLAKLSEAGLKVRKNKCSFAVNSTEFLGYKISPEGIAVSEERIQALLDAPKPTNESEVRGLLGGLVMLRRFDPRIAEKTLFLNPLTNSLNWEGEEDKKLEDLKEVLREMMKNPKNMRPNPELPLIVKTDASKKAVGASLIQEVPNEDGSKEKVLIYAASRSFKSAETRYSTIRRELLAVVFAVQKFRRFLIGRDFLIRTDHRPLVGLFKKPLLSIENEDLRDLVSQMSEYSFTVEYVPGPSNAFPYWLSRNCLDEVYSYQDHRRNEGRVH